MDKKKDRKRKNAHDLPIEKNDDLLKAPDHHEEDGNNRSDDFLSLSLSSFHHHSPTVIPPPILPSAVHNHPPILPSPPSTTTIIVPPAVHHGLPPQVLPSPAPANTTPPHILPSPIIRHPPPLPTPAPPPPQLIPPSPAPPCPLFTNPHLTPPPPADTTPAPPGPGPVRTRRKRRNPSTTPAERKSDFIPPPFPWSTNIRANIHCMDYLLSMKIYSIAGDVQCKRCESHYTMEFHLEQKFAEIRSFIEKNKYNMHHRAPKIWLNPTLPKCRFCELNSAKPVIPDKKRSINWLFLLLGGMLGCCTLEQLKYFCKHTNNHRTGAKDRVLYLTYLGLCRQLDPDGPFGI